MHSGGYLDFVLLLSNKLVLIKVLALLMMIKLGISTAVRFVLVLLVRLIVVVISVEHNK